MNQFLITFSIKRINARERDFIINSIPLLAEYIDAYKCDENVISILGHLPVYANYKLIGKWCQSICLKYKAKYAFSIVDANKNLIAA